MLNGKTPIETALSELGARHDRADAVQCLLRTSRLKAYRIGSSRHPLWDGHGALIYGARWNSPGRGPIYAAETYSGAMLEMLVRVGRMVVPPDYQYLATKSTFRMTWLAKSSW